MKTILCYGDSITWGYIPGNAGRYAREIRWPNVMQKDLGSGYEIITEGLRGRYTVHDEPYRPGRNGAALLQPILDSHSPVDLLIILLGTNDVLHYPAVTSADAARGIDILIKIAQASETGPNDTSPKILIISPPLIGTLSAELQQLCHGDPAHSAKFAEYFQKIADQRGVYFLDGAGVCAPSPIDGVHLDDAEHRRLGQAVGKVVIRIFESET
jgi:lysophospholipase L1-like esterase